MIALERVSCRIDGRAIVRDVSFAVGAGECLALVGPSGCGKSTTLRLVNRLIERADGRVMVEGRDNRAVPLGELRRRIGYAIQSTGLFPHWTVARNVGTVPRLLGWPPARIRERTDALLEALDLAPDRVRDVRPSQLSGGQQQRVGLARALAADPPMLLLDEPFSALDPVGRRRAQDLVLRRRDEYRTAILLVTHDMDEALRLGTAVAAMEDGRIVRAASPEAFLDDPGSEAVLAMLGGEEGRKDHRRRLRRGAA